MIKAMLAREPLNYKMMYLKPQLAPQCVMYIQNAFTKDIMPVVSVVFTHLFC